MYDISVPFGLTFNSILTELVIFQVISCFSNSISKLKTTPKVTTTNRVIQKPSQIPQKYFFICSKDPRKNTGLVLTYFFYED